MAMRLLAAFACAVATLPAAAALYKWTDANGRVVYSDQAPTGNVKYEVVAGAPPPSNPNAVKEMAQKEVEYKRRAKDAADKDQKTEAQRVEMAKRLEMCQRAQSNIKQLSADRVALVRYNEKGEAVYVDDATRRKERVEIEAWVKQNCPQS
ncbi:MAG: DUF4124 domain-containing protein [Burkholderiales bacterium]|nr:DUF4124 domain-containing protein [Burkholderiales bacterium]